VCSGRRAASPASPFRSRSPCPAIVRGLVRSVAGYREQLPRELQNATGKLGIVSSWSRPRCLAPAETGIGRFRNVYSDRALREPAPGVAKMARYAQNAG
jgi:hypothetical protein